MTCPLPAVCDCKACTGAELLPPLGERPWEWTTLAASACSEDGPVALGGVGPLPRHWVVLPARRAWAVVCGVGARVAAAVLGGGA